eukprot:g75485.t1
MLNVSTNVKKSARRRHDVFVRSRLDVFVDFLRIRLDLECRRPPTTRMRVVCHIRRSGLILLLWREEKVGPESRQKERE